jgi:hypothetical protein
MIDAYIIEGNAADTSNETDGNLKAKSCQKDCNFS